MVDGADISNENAPGLGPYDTPMSAGLRFAVELIAWVAGPWAVAEMTGSWWLAIPAAVVLIGMAAVFSTPGDKQNVAVATPGPIRLGIELLTLVVAVAGAWVVWPVWAATLATVLSLGAAVTGARRARWLAAGAPAPGAAP